MAAKHNNRVSSANKVFNRKKSMSDTLYAQNLFSEAFPKWRYGSVKAMVREAHTFIGRRVVKDFTYRRARSIWEGKARRIDGEELDALRAAVFEETRREQRELRARLGALDEMLARVDEAFHGETLAAIREQTRGLGRVPDRRSARS